MVCLVCVVFVGVCNMFCVLFVIVCVVDGVVLLPRVYCVCASCSWFNVGCCMARCVATLRACVCIVFSVC